MTENEKRSPIEPSSEDITKQLAIAQFRIDFLRDPEEALIKWGGVKSGDYERWYKEHFSKLVLAVAQKTNADPKQIFNKETRTPEQEHLLVEEAAKQQIARIDAFFESAYMDAINTLKGIQGTFNPSKICSFSYSTINNEFGSEDDIPPESDYITIREQAILYFFSIHNDLKPQESIPLTQQQKDELRDIYIKLDAFYSEYTNSGEFPVDSSEVLLAFIEKENSPSSNSSADGPKQLTLEQVAQHIQSIIPRNHVMPNNTLMNVLQNKSVINTGAFDMPVMPAIKRRKEVTAYVDVSMETQTDSGIAITDAHLTEYERQVYDAIVTLWITANEEKVEPIFTLDKIYSNMPGSGERATPQQKAAITRAIERFRRLHIVLDATEEMRRRGKIGEKSTFTMDNFFLTATRAKYTIEKGGQEVIAYRIDSKPINLIYAEMTRQILTVPVKVITFSKVKPNLADKSLVTISTEPITMNESRQAMAGYLLRRICVMKHDLEEAREEKRSYDRKRRRTKDLEEKPVEAFRKQSSVILFSTLFETTGTATDNRDKALDNRKFCYEILNYWKAIDFISNYEEQKKGRSITGIKIML